MCLSGFESLIVDGVRRKPRLNVTLSDICDFDGTCCKEGVGSQNGPLFKDIVVSLSWLKIRKIRIFSNESIQRLPRYPMHLALHVLF